MVRVVAASTQGLHQKIQTFTVGRSEIYETRRKSESSLMAKGIFKGASRESDAVIKAALGE